MRRWETAPQAPHPKSKFLGASETALPADTPSGHLDTTERFAFVGALEVSNGASTYKGSAVALSPEWVLTAGHNADLNDDGLMRTDVFS